MINVRTLIFVAPLLASAHAAAQAPQSASPGSAIVFKCTSADGSVTFSDAPCADTQKSQRVDTSRALRTSSGGHQEQIASSVADSDCRRGAQRSAYASIDMKIEESNRHIADYQQRLGALASQKIYAPDGSGNMIDDPGAQKAIVSINAAIEKERDFQRQIQTNAAAAYQNAINDCDKNATAKASQSP